MKHNWLDVRLTQATLGSPRRSCSNCGAEQKKVSSQSWGRVTGYSWDPLVGRCIPPKNVQIEVPSDVILCD
jgi:hypothetical protein